MSLGVQSTKSKASRTCLSRGYTTITSWRSSLWGSSSSRHISSNPSNLPTCSRQMITAVSYLNFLPRLSLLASASTPYTSRGHAVMAQMATSSCRPSLTIVSIPCKASRLLMKRTGLEVAEMAAWIRSSHLSPDSQISNF